ncbi:hypothetical protein IF1G_00336 [Cordyceps javanica]|uniref:Uncharacterized protein n=1 Tax=Cordyceps javanica TaxID=43265 RepID=A0A545WCB6_9HYPO|nr:hypothetical protein IF1G_00336 [Cordyceps javanica]TQW11592.1 hypothetical protein IF2G_00323 [Cordyceps javanica]
MARATGDAAAAAALVLVKTWDDTCTEYSTVRTAYMFGGMPVLPTVQEWRCSCGWCRAIDASQHNDGLHLFILSEIHDTREPVFVERKPEPG